MNCTLGIREVCDMTLPELFEEVRDAAIFLLVVILLSLVVEHLLHRCKVDMIPEPLVTVCLGSVLGGVFWMLCTEAPSPKVVRLCFTWFLNLVALPVIIFESGWSLRFRDFVSQMGYIMLFAVGGTIISIVVVATLTIFTSPIHGITCWRTAIAYASLISSVDPVATLATFGKLNVDPLLFILVFGESQINDAVAITVFKAVNEHDLGHPSQLIWQMMFVLCGSILLGLALGFIYLLTLRFTHLGHSPAQAVLFIFISCFLTFCIGEWCELSGIITVLFNSIFMGNYVGCHLTSEGMALTSFLLKQMSSLSDTIIFIFCGIMAIFVVMSNGLGMTLGFTMSLICLVARFAAIVPVGLFSNGLKCIVSKQLPKEKDHMISWKHMFMMGHSGLRGGVSLALVMQMGDWVNEGTEEDMKLSLVDATFVLVVLYLLVFGSTTGPCLRMLGLPLGDQVPEGKELYDKSDKHGWGWRWTKYMRKKVVLPIVVGPMDLKQPDLVSSRTSMLVDVIREAADAEAQPEFGMQLRRHSSLLSCQGGSVEKRVSMINLFGTLDPVHVDALEDCVEQNSETDDSRNESSVDPECQA